MQSHTHELMRAAHDKAVWTAVAAVVITIAIGMTTLFGIEAGRTAQREMTRKSEEAQIMDIKIHYNDGTADETYTDCSVIATVAGCKRFSGTFEGATDWWRIPTWRITSIEVL